MDPYLALIGGTPTEAEKQQALASRLRRQADYGMLGQITGDAVLSPMGKQLFTQADSEARQLGDNRLRAAQQALTKGYYDQQARQHRENLGLNRQKQRDLQQWRLLQAAQKKAELDAKAAQAAQAAKAKADSEAEPDYGKLRSSDITALKEVGSTAANLRDLRSRLGEEGFDPGGTDIPFERTASNLVAQYGWGPEEMKKSQDWWANFNRFYTLPERNALFGATLTPNEQRAWESATIGPEMKKEQITKKLDDLIRIYNNVSKRMAEGYISEKYNPESVKKFMGFDATNPEEMKVPPPPEPSLPPGVKVRRKK